MRTFHRVARLTRSIIVFYLVARLGEHFGLPSDIGLATAILLTSFLFDYIADYWWRRE